MPQTWTGRTGWTLTHAGSQLTLTLGDDAMTWFGVEARQVRVGWRWFRRCLVLSGERTQRIPGVAPEDVAGIRETLARIVIRETLRDTLGLAVRREQVFSRLLTTRISKRRWIAHDDVATVLKDLPDRATALSTLTDAQRRALPRHLTRTERRALAFLDADHAALVARANAEIARRELAAERQFFARIEKSPLTEEQARAVIAYDNRVRVVAAAGSGKTSVMVARAAYAVRRGFARPDRILMLAFNADAARELGDRVTERLRAAGIPHAGIQATTFHAFGLSVIAEATGSRPRIAPWVEGGKDVAHIGEIVEALHTEDASFARAWQRALDGGDDTAMHRLVRTFMSHVKAQGLEATSLKQRAATERATAFLDAYWSIHTRWQADLDTADAIDFDDMLATAAHHLDRDPTLARYDLVMVDEFQDTSRARALLVKGLLRERGTHLLAVGDDWQAINGFAGADHTLMTSFEEVFGPALTRRLETTFRTTQAVADVAGRFVSRNPAQLDKRVRAARGAGGTAVRIVRVSRNDAVAGAVASVLVGLADAERVQTVDVLGRYGFDQRYLPDATPDGVTARFRTIHRAKGLEADHVILPHVTSGRYGFPSAIPQDPLLAMVAPAPDDYPHAEERRLLYVALTRARETVTLVTVAGHESPFILELLEDPDVEEIAPGQPPALTAALPANRDGHLL